MKKQLLWVAGVLCLVAAAIGTLLPRLGVGEPRSRAFTPMQIVLCAAGSVLIVASFVVRRRARKTAPGAPAGDSARRPKRRRGDAGS